MYQPRFFSLAFHCVSFSNRAFFLVGLYCWEQIFVECRWTCKKWQLSRLRYSVLAKRAFVPHYCNCSVLNWALLLWIRIRYLKERSIQINFAINATTIKTFSSAQNNLHLSELNINQIFFRSFFLRRWNSLPMGRKIPIVKHKIKAAFPWFRGLFVLNLEYERLPLRSVNLFLYLNVVESFVLKVWVAT